RTLLQSVATRAPSSHRPATAPAFAFLLTLGHARSTLFPYTSLFRSEIPIIEPLNLAVGKPTTQSSTGYGGDSSRAVDGNTDGYRSEEHTSELQSRENLVCRLLLEKKNN